MNLLFINWNVDPILFSTGSFSVGWYGVLLAFGFLLGYIILSKIMRGESYPQERIDVMSIYIIVGVVVGLRLGHCLFYDPGYYLTNPLEILKIWEGGLASHGGAIGILIAIWLFTRKYKIPYLAILDRIILIIPLAGGMVRLGNLMNSEILGNPTNVSWGFNFLRNSPDYHSAIEASKGACDATDLQCLADFWVPRHPTQLYEAIFYFIMFAIFLVVYRKYASGWKNGVMLGWFLIVLFTFRFIIEFTKTEQAEFEVWTDLIRVGQLLSVPFILLGIFLIIRPTKSKENNKLTKS